MNSLAARCKIKINLLIGNLRRRGCELKEGKANSRAVKTGGPARLGPALTGFRLYRTGPKSPVEKRA
ncbi:hypothetical protein MTR_8g075745 [Medicago truncatula]|uniref:Uncharacterized protein n=1 Tax=Medicago truncatula TaxID=3880 RepID=A0A072TSD0_MEDTR|nr:hypothetical protein MTR_8g075745 [Medicago truncatula]